VQSGKRDQNLRGWNCIVGGMHIRRANSLSSAHDAIMALNKSFIKYLQRKKSILRGVYSMAAAVAIMLLFLSVGPGSAFLTLSMGIRPRCISHGEMHQYLNSHFHIADMIVQWPVCVIPLRSDLETNGVDEFTAMPSPVHPLPKAILEQLPSKSHASTKHKQWVSGNNSIVLSYPRKTAEGLVNLAKWISSDDCARIAPKNLHLLLHAAGIVKRSLKHGMIQQEWKSRMVKKCQRVLGKNEPRPVMVPIRDAFKAGFLLSLIHI